MPKNDYTSGNPYVKAFNDALGTFQDFSTFLADPGERQNIRQGAMDAINRGAVAGALGFPVDTANAALNLGKATVGYLGNKAGVLSADQMPKLNDKPFLGSEYIGNQMRRFGMVSPNRNALAEGIAGFLPISPSASGKAVAALAGGGVVPGMEAATFIGPNAKTWDGAAARKALEMEKAGVSPQQIWSETGTFRGADGRLRQEIDDSKSLFNPSGDPGMRRSTGIPFASMPDLNYGPNALMEHPLLEKAYGNLVPNTFIFNRDGSGVEGSFDAAKAAINLGAPVTGQAGRSTALHELQHAVQNREGFARGGNTGEFAQGPMFDQRARELSSELSQSLTGGLSARPEEIIGSLKFGDPATLNGIAAKYGFKDINEAAAFLKNEDARRTPYGQYQRLAGEAEARATQARMDMTPEQRRATFPFDSYDVPVNQLIIR